MQIVLLALLPGKKFFMTPKAISIPAVYTKEVHQPAEQGQPTMVRYTPEFANVEQPTRAECHLLFTEQRHFTIAFTPFCPLHATNLHAAALCPQWQAKLKATVGAKQCYQMTLEERTRRRSVANDMASSSREAIRDA